MVKKKKKVRTPSTPGAPGTPGASDVEKAVEEHEDFIEDLDNVDIGFDNIALTEVAKQERLSLAIGYQRLYIQASNLKISMKANESVGNKEAVEKFRKQAQEVETNLKHILRSIKNIDSEYPKAKKRMKEMVRQQHIEAGLLQPDK